MPRCIIYYLHLLFCWAITAQSNSNQVLEAITLCREKLIVDPDNTKIQHSLAQLLDSQISTTADQSIDTSLVDEVLQLYLGVGQPSLSAIDTQKRLPPARIRFESLIRAGTIAKDLMHDTQASIKYYTLAMSLDGVEDSSLLLAYETVMPMLVSSINVDHQVQEILISPDGQYALDRNASFLSYELQHQIQQSFDLCNLIETKYPVLSLVDEYRGALLRRLEQSELAYQSYHQAMVKSKQRLDSEVEKSNYKSKEYFNLVADFVRTSILVAAAAREAGYDLQQQMKYLNDVEQVTSPLLGSLDDMDEQSQHSLRDAVLELYNNMGIAQKKQGSMKRAQDFFRRALEISPSDGHALVQLASIDDDATSNIKQLSPEYVGALFDGYSSRFESELVDVLQYKGHTLIFEAFLNALKRLGKSPLSIKKVIDLGCGSGLLGELIRSEMPWISTLAGVDLSQRMVELSRERKTNRGSEVYTSVETKEATEFLSALDQKVDAILASDVIIYVGDLSPLLEESFKCLSNDGLFGFTIESYEGTNKNGFKLQKSGRFGHSKSYIEKVAKHKGFEVLSWEDCTLRQQGGKDVKGVSVILRKML